MLPIRSSKPKVLAPFIVAARTTSETETTEGSSLINFAKFAACLMTLNMSKSLLDEHPSVPRETFIPISFAFFHSNAPLASFKFEPGQ